MALAGAGYDLVIAARSQIELDAVRSELETAGATAIAIPTDLRILEQVDRLVEQSLAFGPVELLVNNCGIAGPQAVLWELDLDAWNETLEVNLTAAFLCCRGLIPQMVERRSGSIVNIGSITGKRPLMGRSPYAASKLGLVGLTRTLALEAGQYGIRVNLISPGFVEGPRIDWVIDRQAEIRGLDRADVRKEFLDHSPLGRLTSPQDVAAAVVFLASERAAGITGVDFNVNAGVVMY
jgi:NAD(P)-dependent dehydrogenase (short-subunit alcohol dehydrogenase family)